jgi:hypothetical protein
VPFTQGAIGRIHVHTRGTPRLINTLCDNALFEGFVGRAREIEERLVDRVARDLGIETAPPQPAAGAPGRPPGGRAAERSRLDLSEIDQYLDSLK